MFNCRVNSREYLEKNGVQIIDIRKASLNAIGARVTPTLILVNEKGEVSQSWIGRLPKQKQQEVKSLL